MTVPDNCATIPECRTCKCRTCKGTAFKVTWNRMPLPRPIPPGGVWWMLECTACGSLWLLPGPEEVHGAQADPPGVNAKGAAKGSAVP